MTPTADDLHRWLERWRDGVLEADEAAALQAALADAETGRPLLRHELRQLGQFTLALGHDADRPGLGQAVQERLQLENEASLFTAAWRQRAQRRRTVLLVALVLLSASLGGAILWGVLAAPPTAPLLVDGSPHSLQAGVLIADQDVERQVLWPARAGSVMVAPGGRLLLQRQGDDFAFRLESGGAWFSAGPQDPQRPLRLHTPDCVAEVIGTRWHCRVAEQGTALAVLNGAVTVRSPTATAICSAQEYVVVGKDGAVEARAGDASAAAAALAQRQASAAAEDPAPPPPAVPALVLLPDRHTPPANEPALLLSATAAAPLRLDVRHRAIETRQGDGLPPPWNAHNWDPDGHAELFTETVDGAVALTMRNHQGHGLMLAPFKRVAVPAGTVGEIVVQYRCRERGRLALAINVDGSRGDTVQAPRISHDWHTAVFRFEAGERDRAVALILLNQTVGPRNDVLLRRAALHILASDSAD